jgi:CRISPR-associated protein Csh1
VIDDCLAIFERQKDIDKLVLDTYVPADGTYIIVKYEDGQFVLPDKPYEVKQDKKTRELSISGKDREKISRIDYYCRLIDMNKPLDTKVIMSNSYLSFFIKKKSLTNGKLTNECIENYYQILKNPYLKYTNNYDRLMYKSVEEEIGIVDTDKVDLVRCWIKNNIFSLPYEIKGEDYLKIFFQFEGVNFETEGKRYYVPNVYNKNDYNTIVEGVVYGLPNNNMGLDLKKKPYLDHKNRKSKVPIMEDFNRIMLKKKFFDYLMNMENLGFYNIYFPIEEREKIRPVDGKNIQCNFEGYFLRIQKEKNEAAIVEADTIASRYGKLKKLFEMQNILNIPEDECEDVFYGKTQDIMQIVDSVNQIFFSKYLINNLFNELQDISVPDKKIEKTLVLYRNAYKNWFYMGFDENMESVIKGTADIVIHNSIDKNNYRKVKHQFNLKWSLIEYFRQGGGKMADVLKQHRDTIQQKINTDRNVYVSIDNDEEYCYAVGQLINYLLGFSKTKNKTYSLANQFFKIKEDRLLKERLNNLFLKYNYIEKMNAKRFEKLYGMICSYEVENGLNQDIMIAGFISPNLIYEKGDK